MLPLRPLTPCLSAHWVGLITPVPNAIARPLVASLIHEAVAAEHDIAAYIPDPEGGLTGFDDAVRLALSRRSATPTWRPGGRPRPGSRAPSEPLPTDPDWSGGTVYTDLREPPVDAPAADLWRVIEAIGGEHGWYSFPLAWSVRGWLDRAVGGVGLRRGRRDPLRLHIGEALDFWRVEEIVRANCSGCARRCACPVGPGWRCGPHRRTTRTAGTASAPCSCPAAWPATRTGRRSAPFHAIVFGGMARNIARAAERGAGPDRSAGR